MLLTWAELQFPAGGSAAGAAGGCVQGTVGEYEARHFPLTPDLQSLEDLSVVQHYAGWADPLVSPSIFLEETSGFREMHDEEEERAELDKSVESGEGGMVSQMTAVCLTLWRERRDYNSFMKAKYTRAPWPPQKVLYTSATVAYFSPVSRHLSSVLLSPSGPLNQGVSGLWAAEVEIDDIHDGSFKAFLSTLSPPARGDGNPLKGSVCYPYLLAFQKHDSRLPSSYLVLTLQSEANEAAAQGEGPSTSTTISLHQNLLESRILPWVLGEGAVLRLDKEPPRGRILSYRRVNLKREFSVHRAKSSLNPEELKS